MSLVLPALFHWSPRERRASINRSGLLPGRKHWSGADSTGITEGRSMVCLAPNPSSAWALSAGLNAERRRQLAGTTWDLWQVQLAPEDAVHMVPSWGDQIHEVRVDNRIPKRRLWWVAERTMT